MTTLEPTSNPQHVLLLLPTAKDAEIATRLLGEKGIQSLTCGDLGELCHEARLGAGALVVAEERLLSAGDRRVEQMLEGQPAWSDLPVIILTLPSQRNYRTLDNWHRSANVTLIERPLQIGQFLSVVHARLKDRARQYVVRDLLESLDARNREFRQLADAMPQMVFTADARGRLEYVNQRAIECLGVDPTKVASVPWAEAIHPDDAAFAEASWKRSLVDGTRFQCEFRVRDVRTSKHRWHLARALPIRDDSGAITRWFGTGTDIHQQKLAEQKLSVALDRAAAAGAAKSEFLANMSHEIRTPMTSILGYAQLLAEQEDDPEKFAFLSIIRQNGGFLLEIINDILDLSKIEAGKLEIVPERFDLALFVQEIHSLMQVRAADSGVRFDVVIEGPTPEKLSSDPKRLRQILINLVGNALKFTHEGEVRLVLSCRQGRVTFDIVDTGIGMTDEQVAQLFQPFHQADTSVSRRFGGTGLGLAISHRLAAMLGGTLSVVSEPNVGSTFTLTLEADERNAGSRFTAPELSHSKSADVPRLECRVLVVDDRRDVRFLAGRILANAGATVEYAEDGLEAAQVIEGHLAAHSPPDIVLMDMQMPVMDGYQAAERLRSIGYKQPIIALTADAMQGDKDRCLESGCNAYLSKPIEKDTMLRTIDHHLRRSNGSDPHD